MRPGSDCTAQAAPDPGRAATQARKPKGCPTRKRDTQQPGTKHDAIPCSWAHLAPAWRFAPAAPQASPGEPARLAARPPRPPPPRSARPGRAPPAAARASPAACSAESRERECLCTHGGSTCSIEPSRASWLLAVAAPTQRAPGSGCCTTRVEHKRRVRTFTKHQRGLDPSPSTQSSRFCTSASRMGPASGYTSTSAQACTDKMYK